jgi:choline monooxygenase
MTDVSNSIDRPRPEWHDKGVTRSSTLPAEWYRSRELFEEEVARIFKHTWQLVGRVDQLRNPGDYFVTSVADEKLVLVRDQEHHIRAFSNVCRHRAGPVALGCGNRQTFQCAYHGWLYGLDGRLRQARELEGTEGFEVEAVRLPEFRVETFGPLVYVSLDPDVPALNVWMSGVIERARNYRFDALTYCGGRSWTVEANWKTYIDNMLEGYHLPFVHPSFKYVVNRGTYSYELGERYNSIYGAEPNPRGPGSRASALFADGSENPVVQFRQLAPPMPALVGPERNGYFFFWVFPNTIFDFMPDGIKVTTARPLDVERTQVVLEWWFPDASLDRRLLQAAVVAFGHQINEEDGWIVGLVQEGLRSTHYSQGRYVAREEMLVHQFHRLMSEYLEGGTVA